MLDVRSDINSHVTHSFLNLSGKLPGDVGFDPLGFTAQLADVSFCLQLDIFFFSLNPSIHFTIQHSKIYSLI